MKKNPVPQTSPNEHPHLVLPSEHGNGVEDLLPLLQHLLRRAGHDGRALHDASAGKSRAELPVLGTEAVRYARVGPVRAAERRNFLQQRQKRAVFATRLGLEKAAGRYPL